jgi:hypothetical protein
VASATFDSVDARDRNRDQLDRIRATGSQEVAAEVLDECDFELALAHLRVPEMAWPHDKRGAAPAAVTFAGSLAVCRSSNAGHAATVARLTPGPPQLTREATAVLFAWKLDRSGPHPRPVFKRRILEAFTDGFKDRPDTTFGTVNADVLAHFVPGFQRIDFVEVILNSSWPE